MKCANCFAETTDRISCHRCNKPLHKECAIKKDGAFTCDVCYTVMDEDTSTQFIMPEVIRRSHIELYKSCPYKFYLEVIQNEPSPHTIYTQLGIDLHEMFDEASKSNVLYDAPTMKKHIKEKFNAYPDMFFETEDSKGKMWERAIDSIDTFHAILPTLPNTPFATEENIIFDVGEDLPKVSITMDRIDKIGDNLEILDWKTGAVMVGKKLSSDLQAPLYINAVRKHYDMNVSKFRFLYVNENKERVFEQITPEDYVCTVGKREYKINLTDAIREVQAIFAQIKKGNFNIPSNVRDMYFTCKMCHQQRIGKCKGADLEGWNQINKGAS